MAMFNRNAITTTGVLPQGMQLIQDTFPLVLKEVKQVVSEAAGGRSVMRLTGIFQRADEPNQNGRIYPKAILGEAIDRIQGEINKRAVLGEFDHPSDAKIHLDRVSHLITKLWMEGKNAYGEAEVIEEMPYGAMLSALMRAKVQVGISSRGVGDMEAVTEGNEERFRVTPGYTICTFDVVAEPSVASAVLSVMESRNRLRQVLTRSARKQDPELTLAEEMDKWLKGRIK